MKIGSAGQRPLAHILVGHAGARICRELRDSARSAPSPHRGVDRSLGRQDDSGMDSKLPPIDIDARLAALLELKREMLQLHAQLEFIRLMLSLGVAPK
jgi:hypothetical protein